MSKEKQIEEISKILTEAAHKACEDIPYAPPNDDDRCIRPTMECHRCKEARALIDAGYRKQSEGEWKWEHDALNDPKRYFVRTVCSCCGLKTGQVSNFCPNCGAKMKGGAE